MARSMRPVTWKEKETDRLPDWAAQGFALVRDLERRGVLEPLSERVRIRREGGYAGIDIVLFLLYYFASGLDVGLRKFWERASPYGVQLAAVAERRQLASPASVSRALEAVEFERVRPLATWLLTEVAGVDDVLRHPAVQHYDANGEGCHVFDFDPTVTALRHRALPAGEDLPEARRRSAATAEAGYSGRKRGDVQFRRATLQHAGSGLWLGAELRPGNGERRAELRAALTTVTATCRRLGIPLGRALVRMDGEFGSVPYFAECREQGVPFITRLNRLELLDDPAVRRRLVEGTWTFVPDDRSGVRRSAMDLGLVTVSAGRDTLRDDGTPYEPIRVRVVVSRYPRTRDAEHGRVIEEWQYELFAVDLPADAWPAEEAVAAYFGRCGQENRFAQEDAELGLDRVLSYHLPGQELATLVGLMVWNQRVARGFELAAPPPETPLLVERKPEIDTRPVPPTTRPEEDPTPEVATQEPVVAPTKSSTAASLRGELAGRLPGLNWEALLTGRPDWTWDAVAGVLRCPEGKALSLTCVDIPRPGGVRFIFRGAVGACEACPRRQRCFTSDVARRPKMVSFTLDRAALGEGAGDGRPATRASTPSTPQPRRPARRSGRIQLDEAGPATAPPGGNHVHTPLFRPAETRGRVNRSTLGLTVYVRVELPGPPIPHPALLSRGVADRQHRRRTWQEHLDRYALPAGSRVTLTVAGSPDLASILGAGAATTRAVA